MQREHQRVAVRLRPGNLGGGRVAAGAGAVIVHHRLAPGLRQPLRDAAADVVDYGAG